MSLTKQERKERIALVNQLRDYREVYFYLYGHSDPRTSDTYESHEVTARFRGSHRSFDIVLTDGFLQIMAKKLGIKWSMPVEPIIPKELAEMKPITREIMSSALQSMRAYEAHGGSYGLGCAIKELKDLVERLEERYDR